MRHFHLPLACLLPLLPMAHSDNESFTGPFYMCPDAHGASQKALFNILDITNLPMRVEGMGARRVDGFAANLTASLQNKLAADPVTVAFTKFFNSTTTFTELSTERKGLVTVCFAKEAPPANDTDGPFFFMPGFFMDESVQVVENRDTVMIPEQTYLVVSWSGASADIANFRFTLTDQFWNKTAPFLGLRRVDGPNIMVWPPGDDGNATIATVEMWTPIQPYVIS